MVCADTISGNAKSKILHAVQAKWRMEGASSGETEYRTEAMAAKDNSFPK
jgi:hypothetical protein